MVYRQGSSRKSGLRSVSGQEHSRKPPVKASRFGQNVLSSGHDWVGKKKKVRDFKPLTCDFSGRDDWIRTSGLTVLNPETLGREWHMLVRAMGWRGSQGEYVRFHDLRHFVAGSHMLRASANPQVAASEAAIPAT